MLKNTRKDINSDRKSDFCLFLFTTIRLDSYSKKREFVVVNHIHINSMNVYM